MAISPLSNKKAVFNFNENVQEPDINETMENMRSNNQSGIQRHDSIHNFFNLKRLSGTSFIFQNRPNGKMPVNEIPLVKEISKESNNANSIRMKINQMKNEDQMKLMRSISNLSNRVNYENEIPKNIIENIQKEEKPEEINSQNKAPSIAPLDADHLLEFDKLKGPSIPSYERDLSWINGTRNHSKRNSLLSNISLFFHREENKDET
mmetsp:Transcript_8952/g.7953  ORF Transcript_8952/g.7953 Transcript_8952/m.7953 type:complete len:207 (-) Transcript_8952:32-652(-)